MHLEGGGYIFEQTFPIKSGYRFGGKCHNSIPKIGGIMNIYLGRNLENFDSNGKSVYFSDEILAYIYAIRNKIDINIESLEQMEPYDDVVIDNQQIVEIMNICEHILKNNVLYDWELQQEAQECLASFVGICKEAIESNQNLISIGD